MEDEQKKLLFQWLLPLACVTVIVTIMFIRFSSFFKISSSIPTYPPSPAYKAYNSILLYHSPPLDRQEKIRSQTPSKPPFSWLSSIMARLTDRA